jgi:hypothetical protein
MGFASSNDLKREFCFKKDSDHLRDAGTKRKHQGIAGKVVVATGSRIGKNQLKIGGMKKAYQTTAAMLLPGRAAWFLSTQD